MVAQAHAHIKAAALLVRRGPTDVPDPKRCFLVLSVSLPENGSADNPQTPILMDGPTHLDLSRNELRGDAVVRVQCLSRLKSLSLRSNAMHGKIPYRSRRDGVAAAVGRLR